MPDRFLIATLAFVIAGRWVHEAGLRKLTPEQKGAVLDSQAGVRKYGLLAMLPFIVAAFYLPRHAPWLVFALVAGVLAFSYRRLQIAALPIVFRRAFLAYSCLYLAGALVFFALIYIGTPTP